MTLFEGSSSDAAVRYRCKIPRMTCRPVSRFLGFAALLLATHAAADTTGYWMDPAEPGWGLSVAEQDGTAFATLLVYDQNGAPTWLVASSLVPIGDDFRGPPGLPTGLSGTLYRTAGSWFAMPFDPSALHVQAVGQLKLLVSGSTQPESMEVQYSVDGRSVDKTVRRQTWASNRGKLVSGATYEGGLYLTSSSTTGTAGCAPISFTPAPGRPFVFQIQAGDGSSVRMAWGTGSDTGCILDGTYEQRGQFGAVTGTLACGPIGGPNPVLPATLEELQINDHGFAGAATITLGDCTYRGNIGGVKQGS